MNDLISRQAAIDAILGITPIQNTIPLDSAIFNIKKLPSAEQKTGEWIPCSERLPSDRDWYLGVFKEPDTGWINPIPFICDYAGIETPATTRDLWIIKECTDIESPAHEYYRNLICVAWMPLPEPYKEEDSNDS